MKILSMEATSSSLEFKTPVKRKTALSDISNKPTPCRSSKKLKRVIPPSPFMKKLGYGTGVNVYLMERSPSLSGKNRSPWAVKKVNSRLKDVSTSCLFEERMAMEAGLLAKIDHPNIIGFRGTSRTPDGDFCLCLENGERSLFDEIETRREEDEGPFPVRTIEKIVFSMAKALSYLHNKHRILHGDIKSPNILLQGPGYEKVKLCDFGVAVKLQADLCSLEAEEEYTGTGPWTCQEALLELPISHKADVYSLGCVVYEMLALDVPHLARGSDSYCEEDGDDEDEDVEPETMFGSTLFLKSDDFNPSYKNLIELMMVCTSEDPEQRPSAAALVDAFDPPVIVLD